MPYDLSLVLDTPNLTSASYDETTNTYTIVHSGASHANKEDACINLIRYFEQSAQGKENSLDIPIASFDNFGTPFQSLISRSNVAGDITETQIENIVQFRYYTIAPDLSTTSAVNDAD